VCAHTVIEHVSIRVILLMRGLSNVVSNKLRLAVQQCVTLCANCWSLSGYTDVIICYVTYEYMLIVRLLNLHSACGTSVTNHVCHEV
jgi:hypothetical protein